jgi:hypothetical protein
MFPWRDNLEKLLNFTVLKVRHSSVQSTHKVLIQWYIVEEMADWINAPLRETPRFFPISIIKHRDIQKFGISQENINL